jgi:hypothetical protein
VLGDLDFSGPRSPSRKGIFMRSAIGLHRIGAEGDASCWLGAYHDFYGAPVYTRASAAVWQKRLTDLFPLPPLFDPDRHR